MLVTRRRLIQLAAALPLLGAAGGCGGEESPYSVERKKSSEGMESQVRLNGQHFLSLIEKPGMVVVRPHPGTDPNGWGTSLYAQPFLSNTQPAGANLDFAVALEEGVQVGLSGSVPRQGGTYGVWSLELLFAYDIAAKKVTATGSYNIKLAGPLSGPAADLNLVRIASNYLTNVPLLSGGVGDTGDMQRADVVGQGFSFSWVPDRDKNHAPTDESPSLSIDVIGDYNRVDTAAQKFFPIAAAYKPSVKIVLADPTKKTGLGFAASYDTSFDSKYGLPKSQLFFEDNVGIHAQAHKNSALTTFALTFSFESVTSAGG